jgi:hypothetical protein
MGLCPIIPKAERFGCSPWIFPGAQQHAPMMP